MTQPVQSPDHTITDLGFFACWKSRVWRERFGTKGDRVWRLWSLFRGCDSETLGGVWQSLFERYSQVLAGLGRNDLEVEYASTGKRQRRVIRLHWFRWSDRPSRWRLISG